MAAMAQGTGTPRPARAGSFDKEPGQYTQDDSPAPGWLDPPWSQEEHFPTHATMQEKQRTQGRLDLGQQHTPIDMKRQATWDDLPDHVRAGVEADVHKRLGLHFGDIVHHYGADLDNAYIRAHNRGSNVATGQDYYTGGPGTDQRRSGQLAAHLGLNTSTVHYARAALSHNSDPDTDLNRTGRIAQQLVHNPDINQFRDPVKEPEGESPPVGTGGFHTTARNAARIIHNEGSGVHPLDVPGESAGATKSRSRGAPVRSAVAASDWAVKAGTYGDAQEFPRVVDANPVIDRHEWRGGAGIKDFGEDTRADVMSGSHNTKVHNVEHPFEPGASIDAMNLYFSHALKTAAQQRGLPSHVAQPVHWYEQKITSYSSKKKGAKAPDEAMVNPILQARQHEAQHGQQGSLF